MSIAPPERLLIAIGGNAIHPAHGPGTAAEQFALAARTGRILLPIMRRGLPLVITHGNGPVVGKILMRQALTRTTIPPMSMDVCVAHLDDAERALHGEAGTQILASEHCA